MPHSDLGEAQYGSIFLRTGETSTDPHYLANMAEVAVTFAQWIRNPRKDLSVRPDNQFGIHAWDHLSVFQRMLSFMHDQAVNGKAGNTLYYPDVYEASRQIGKTSAGQYRAWAMQSFDPRLPLSHHSILSPEVASKIRQLLPRIPMHIELEIGVPTFIYQPQVAGLPTEALPSFSFEGPPSTRVYFHYPPANKVNLYLAQMEKTLSQILPRLDQPHSDSTTLRLLARYYHLMIVGHPFARVNNSLVMTQVNVMLDRMGLNPIPHGDLDYLMRSMNSDDAEDAFIAAVRQKNPNL